MYEFIFEIYDIYYHTWYEDYRTDNIETADYYFNKLTNHYDKGCIRVITKFKEELN